MKKKCPLFGSEVAIAICWPGSLGMPCISGSLTKPCWYGMESQQRSYVFMVWYLPYIFLSGSIELKSSDELTHIKARAPNLIRLNLSISWKHRVPRIPCLLSSGLTTTSNLSIVLSSILMQHIARWWNLIAQQKSNRGTNFLYQGFSNFPILLKIPSWFSK